MDNKYEEDNINSIEADDECPYDHTPNKKTIKSLKNIEERRNLIEVKTLMTF